MTTQKFYDERIMRAFREKIREMTDLIRQDDKFEEKMINFVEKSSTFRLKTLGKEHVRAIRHPLVLDKSSST